jgi:hypothetical protein
MMAITIFMAGFPFLPAVARSRRRRVSGHQSRSGRETARTPARGACIKDRASGDRIDFADDYSERWPGRHAAAYFLGKMINLHRQ